MSVASAMTVPEREHRFSRNGCCPRCPGQFSTVLRTVPGHPSRLPRGRSAHRRAATPTRTLVNDAPLAICHSCRRHADHRRGLRSQRRSAPAAVGRVVSDRLVLTTTSGTNTCSMTMVRVQQGHSGVVRSIPSASLSTSTSTWPSPSTPLSPVTVMRYPGHARPTGTRSVPRSCSTASA